MHVVITGEVDAAAVRQLADLLVRIGAPGVVAATGSRPWVRSFPCSRPGCPGAIGVPCWGRTGAHTERWAMADLVVSAVLLELPLGTNIRHGDAPGLDRLVDRAARRIGFASVAGRPADWSQGKHAGHLRNQEIIDIDRPRLLLAFNVGKSGTAGTNDMIRRALAASIPVFEVRR